MESVTIRRESYPVVSGREGLTAGSTATHNTVVIGGAAVTGPNKKDIDFPNGRRLVSPAGAIASVPHAGSHR